MLDALRRPGQDAATGCDRRGYGPGWRPRPHARRSVRWPLGGQDWIQRHATR